MAPTRAHGKICYLEIPAVDAQTSAEFYSSVFHWQLRRRGDGQLAFDDGCGEVSGAFVVGRRTHPEPGLLFYIMVDDLAAAVDAVKAAGGEIVQQIDPEAREKIARFLDPGGNVIGLYQEA